ncbi:hypothetical protein HHL16_20710 [Pseudoflavitalea sp. G-6-1-2]|uniref:PsbP-related protein n=1 Tax=Pseudoflavitalea sp. G-6-1-2 TaxID=2728841 RepID=UPI00146F88C9|nr:PsbP-related protein [Pseudoflavitalea sp. G-6-1-2]NML23313.1 hypothetical protein [Pseudoflavitalea sp. G-6-1-2]
MKAFSLHSSASKTSRFFSASICVWILLLATPALLHAQQKTNNNGGWSRIFRPTYSILAPHEWRVDSSQTRGCDLYFFSPKEDATDPFSENVNVVLLPIDSTTFNLEKAVASNLTQINQMLADVTILKSETVTENGRSFYVLDYQGKYGVHNIRITQHCFAKGNMSYVLTLTTRIDTYDKYKDIGLKIMKSIIFENTIAEPLPVMVQDYTPPAKGQNQ